MSLLFPKPTKKAKEKDLLEDLPFSKTRGRNKLKTQKTERGDKEQLKIKGNVIVYQNPEILEYVRNLGCCNCDAKAPSDPHHLNNSVGSKRSIDLVVPLCRTCHNLVEDKHIYEHPTWVWYALQIWQEVLQMNLLEISVRAIVSEIQANQTPILE